MALARREWRSVFQPRPTSVRGDVGDAQPPPGNDARESSWRLLNTINDEVNAAIIPVSNTATAGSWVLPPQEVARPSGDCKLYVLEKRRALIAAGMAPAALSIAIVETPRDETHAVLLAATSNGDVVLDNLTRWIVPWDDARYRWIERQVPGEPLQWVAIEANGAV